MRNVLAVGLMIVAAGAACADPVTGKVARKMLFLGKAVEVEFLADSPLAADQQVVLGLVAEGQPYYGAIAISPDEGLMSEATVAAANHHDVDAAQAAALADCNARKTGAAKCVVVALIRPAGWQPRDLQLSAAATAAFKADYKAKGSAVAVSPATGAWGMGQGDGAAEAAVTACAVTAKDCALAIAD